jgi:hypothetical protein
MVERNEKAQDGMAGTCRECFMGAMKRGKTL